jgi:hypothetical protein
VRLLPAIAAVAIAAVAAAPAQAADKCGDAETKKLTAVDMRTKGGLDCGVATVIVRSYLRDVTESEGEKGGCAVKRFKPAGCKVGADFRCFARITDDGETRGRCGDGRLRVKFTEVARGST